MAQSHDETIAKVRKSEREKFYNSAFDPEGHPMYQPDALEKNWITQEYIAAQLYFIRMTLQQINLKFKG